MIAQVISAETARTADVCIGLTTLVFVLFDSLSKKADVTGLKKDLDLREGQLLSEVVDDLETAITPLFEGRTQYAFEDDLIEPPAATLDDSARDSLTEVIRRNEDRFAKVRSVRRLPGTIHKLNSAVYWLLAAVSLASFLCAGALLMFSFGQATIWLLLGTPCTGVLATAIVAAVRQTKVQNAEKQILDTDSEA